jgi:hypothetical protein
MLFVKDMNSIVIFTVLIVRMAAISSLTEVSVECRDLLFRFVQVGAKNVILVLFVASRAHYAYLTLKSSENMLSEVKLLNT